MSKDFVSNQVQVNKIIASGSTGTNAKILVYAKSADSQVTPSQGVIDSNVMPTGSIGTDTFMYVSGGINSDKTTFGGTVHISGNLEIDGSTNIPGINSYVYSPSADVAAVSGTMQVSGGLVVKSGITGALNFVSANEAFLIPDGGLTTSTASNGQVTVSATALSSAIASDIISTEASVTSLSQSVTASFANVSTSITSLSQSVTASFANVSTSITSLSQSVTASFGITNGTITTLSNSVASDIFQIRFPSSSIDSSGDRTLQLSDNGNILLMSGSSQNIIRIPNGLPMGFNVGLVQASAKQIVVVSTSSLRYASTTFKSGSAELNSYLCIFSASLGPQLVGDLEKV
jgi:hypothetical protein